MALKREVARLSKLLVDSGEAGFEEAQRRIDGLTLEILVGADTASPAAHAAILTAISVGSRCFCGGVRVTGLLDQPLVSALPLPTGDLSEACAAVGSRQFGGEPHFTIVIGDAQADGRGPGVAAHWDGWTAGVRDLDARETYNADASNPLAGVVAGALAVAAAFDHARGQTRGEGTDVDLWGCADAPRFEEVLLPGAVWIVGLGNLGQAFLWALGCLPYADPSQVTLHIQDFDRVTAENWGTSVLVTEGRYGELKNKVAEGWIDRRGFDVRRIDRRLLPSDRLDDGDPAVAFSGMDKVAPRRDMANLGFDAIIDAGLGRTAANFDKFRVNVFHPGRPINRHLEGMGEAAPAELPPTAAYGALEAAIGRCGAAEIAGASVAVPHVSAVAAAIAASRAIALVSGCPVPFSEIRRVGGVPIGPPSPQVRLDSRRLCHAGRPTWPFETRRRAPSDG